MNTENLPLLIILALSLLGNNQTVSIAAAILLLIKLLGIDSLFPVLEGHGITAGIALLTIAVLVPVATGRITLTDMAHAFKTPVGITAIIAGIFAAWVGSRGVFFMQTSPEVVTSLIVGTIIGVCFFHGLAVGPLIASGLVYLVVSLAGLFK